MADDSFTYSPDHDAQNTFVFNKQREIRALDRQGTQQQRPESPTVALPCMQVNARYVDSIKGTSSRKDAPQWPIYPPFQPCRINKRREIIAQAL